MNKSSYRPDIDGLRGIAVLSVVIYHFNIAPLTAGFVGVDIFFVISGYLITGIIKNEIERGNFTFTRFYERRIRRIFPALFGMLLAVLAVGALLLLPYDLRRLGGATIATLFMGSNVLFWRQSGYFDSTSDYNPLLHTWSLAVEEQFYIGFPILLVLVHRFAPRTLKPVLIGSMLISFALCVWVQAVRPTATFFLPPFRAWELLLGSIIAIGVVPAISNRILRETAAMVALVVLLGSLIYIEKGSSFPGWQAAFPALSTAALLHIGGQGHAIVHRALSWRPLVLVGMISYSLYLWHWPLLVYARYSRGMEPLPTIFAWGLAAVAILIAWASYRWIETPFRHQKDAVSNSPKPVFLAAAGAMTMIGCLGILVTFDQGWQRRFPYDVVQLDSARSPFIPYRACEGVALSSSKAECIVGSKNVSAQILLWGDSHAIAWAPAFEQFSKNSRARGHIAVRSACPPLLGVKNPVSYGCNKLNWDVMYWIKKERPDQVYLVASWLSYSQPDGQYSLIDDNGNYGNALVFGSALRRTIESIRPYVRQIILVGPTPGAPGDVVFKLAMSKSDMRPLPPPNRTTQFRRDSENFWREANPYSEDQKVVLVDPAPWFCDTISCRYQGDGGELLYRDGGHLSIAGADYVARHFQKHLLFAVLAENEAQALVTK
jgi:peptidoglycan/LPS O-acetylase OafA/YrhL